MTRYLPYFLMIGLILTALSNRTEADVNPDTAKLLADRSNTLAIQLYQQQATQPGNQVFSPASIHLAMSMAAAGANGKTLTQMEQVLTGDWPATAGDRHGAAAALLNALVDKPQQEPGTPAQEQVPFFNLNISNDFWLAKNFAVQPAFTKKLTGQYHAHIELMDFSDAAGAAKIINDTIAKETNDKIKDLISPGALGPLTRLVLTNAVYFKARWSSEFHKSQTKDEPFHSSLTQSANAPMMHQSLRTGYFENDTLKAIELRYLGNEASMILVLPNKTDGLAAVEHSLGDLSKWEEGLQVRRVNLALPKFKFETGFEVTPMLEKLGMTDAFNATAADFSGIATGQGLFLQSVIHKAMIDVNEEGTEAAAATAIMMAGSAMPRPEKPAEFIADHPFFFVIRHNQTRAILFLGRVVKP